MQYLPISYAVLVLRCCVGHPLTPRRYCGYEVTTEGDSFTIAFHDAFDAVCWSLAMQQAMLEAGACVKPLCCGRAVCGRVGCVTWLSVRVG